MQAASEDCSKAYLAVRLGLAHSIGALDQLLEKDAVLLPNILLRLC